MSVAFLMNHFKSNLENQLNFKHKNTIMDNDVLNSRKIHY